MPDFRTVLHTPVSAIRMAISDRIFTIGSCFSDVMGARFAAFKLKTHVNPVGILYNPVSIHRAISLAIHDESPNGSNYTSGDPVFHYDFHSSYFGASAADLQERLEEVLRTCRDGLQKAEWLIITYGTAWIYRHRENGSIVANCHKQPAHLFTKELLDTNDITDSFAQLMVTLKAFNPQLKVILTISPVRHTKDTLEGNALSKSVLRVACEKMMRQHSHVYYFPAFEIMMDDLRDYRFYKADMIHPSEVAEDYIWEKFAGCWFDDQLLTFVHSWKPVLQALQHRAFHPSSEVHQQFLKATLQKVDAWSHLVNVEEERNRIMAQIDSH